MEKTQESPEKESRMLVIEQKVLDNLLESLEIMRKLIGDVKPTESTVDCLVKVAALLKDCSKSKIVRI